MNLLPHCSSVFLAAALLGLAPQDPNPAIKPVARTDEGILARQAEVLRRAKETAKAPVIFIGDSITQGWEDNVPKLWQERFAALGALNLGVSGDRTEHVLWRLQQAPIGHLEPKVIVLLIGTNNLGHGSSNAEQTLAGVLEVVAQLHAQAPQAMVFLHEIFPRGERMNPMRGDIAQINQVLRGRVDAKTRVIHLGDSWVRADGTIPKEIMPDFLHLSPAGYEQWSAVVLPEIQSALK